MERHLPSSDLADPGLAAEASAGTRAESQGSGNWCRVQVVDEACM
jgi:hypothetical protein